MSRPPFRLARPVVRIAPSLLSADFAIPAADLARIEAAGAEMIHLDVMDGHFVPNISFGVPVIKSLRPRSRLFFDAHLMISEPGRYAEPFIQAGCDHLTFHIEVVSKPQVLVDEIHRLGASAGVCLNPTTPVSAIEKVMEAVDLVLVMSVWPGFGGQKFMPEVLDKVADLRSRLAPHQRLQIDGGIDENTIEAAAKAGADTFVAGTAVFGKPDPPQAMKNLLRLAGGD
jgi:ribulose-phosphate 3-epimerase